MNSYPPELLAQLAPVMFVAGLGPANQGQAAPTTPATSSTPSTPSRAGDAYQTLTKRLRDVLLNQRKVAVWQPDRTKTFQVILVDKEIRFPPRKYIPPGEQPTSHPNAHSPLSPLTPTSPLYPDGLIAPIWIRKHTSLVPSVFVLFLRLPELPPAQMPRSPLDLPDPEMERLRAEEERRKDTELSQDIAARKKGTTERNVKLTVVLIASRRMLDDPALDTRLTYIRRTSGLDSRAALFVLSPVSASELEDFVRSLQEALHEPAVEYYTSHSKRVRRKRNRQAQSASSYGPLSPALAGGPPRPLRPEGWNVRYEFKMACFAEFRGEYEVALKHYQDAYAMLLTMFSSSSMLPPRTKRWAEGKVLADCISIKISKLYLYNAEHGLALSNHNQHVRKFCELSRSWGIGEDVFEYWSWVARQYRVLAELLEQGMRSTLKIPTHIPVPPTQEASIASRPQVPLDGETLRALGTNPGVALQHPGFYYYMAARCTEKRRERFIAAAESETGSRTTPGFANESKVDHLTIVQELYTRAYELFKKQAAPQTPAQGRLTLWIAYRIGQTYFESNRFDMASRFFERIARTYRREMWNLMLQPLLSTWYKCAQQMGDVELSVSLLLEMIACGYSDSEDPDALCDDLMAVLKSTVPSSKEAPVVVDLSESEPLLDSAVVFWDSEVLLGTTAPFQIALSVPESTHLSSVTFVSLSVYFSGDEESPTLLLEHEEVDTETAVQYVNVGDFVLSEPTVHKANLRWEPLSSLIIGGQIMVDTPRTLEVTKLVLQLKQGDWTINLPQRAHNGRRGASPHVRWLRTFDPPVFVNLDRDTSSLTIRHRPHQLRTVLAHDGPAYVDERHAITAKVTNDDSRPVEVVMDVLLHPTDADNAVNHIMVNEEQSSGLIKGIDLGVLAPGATTTKTVYLTSTGGAGDRHLDFSFQATSIDDNKTAAALSPEAPSLQDSTELLESLVVPTINPFGLEHKAVYRRATHAAGGILDLATFEGDYWDDADGGEAVLTTSLASIGPWTVQIENCRLFREDGECARVIDSFMDHQEDAFIGDWAAEDEFSNVCVVSLAPDSDHESNNKSIRGPGRYEITWRRLTTTGDPRPLCITRLPLPNLQPPTDDLIALLHVAPTARLHRPMEMKIVIRNRHPSRTAHVTVAIDVDNMDAFIVSGVRSGRVPILLPGTEASLTWSMIPLECGFVRVPRLRVTDRRKPFVAAGDQSATTGPNPEADAPGRVIKVVDVRWDERDGQGQESLPRRRNSLDSDVTDDEVVAHIGSVLVMP